MWGWIGKWFDKGTTEKIFILESSRVLSTLSLFIEPSSIPISFGGELDWSWGDRPLLDTDAKETLGLDELPKGSLRWINNELVLKGTGRPEEEIKRCTPKPKKQEQVVEEAVAVPEEAVLEPAHE